MAVTVTGVAEFDVAPLPNRPPAPQQFSAPFADAQEKRPPAEACVAPDNPETATGVLDRRKAPLPSCP